MKPKIVPIGKIWKSEANGWVYHRGGGISHDLLWRSQWMPAESRRTLN